MRCVDGETGPRADPAEPGRLRPVPGDGRFERAGAHGAPLSEPSGDPSTALWADHSL